MKNIKIRLETSNDYRIVENLVRDSFWNIYRPGCMEHFILNKMRNDSSFVKELDFVMTDDEEIFGQIVFAKAIISLDNGGFLPVLTMGPVAIAKGYQKKGYGKKLVNYALSKARELGFGAVLIEGSINFYKNCGFDYAEKYGIKYNDLALDDLSFFLAIELTEGYLKNAQGNYITPEIYLCADKFEEEFLKYESSFPYKEKLVLERQLK